MAISYEKNDTSTSVKIGHAFVTNGFTDTYEYNRYYARFVITGAGTFRGSDKDGRIEREEIIATGEDPTPTT